MQEIEAEENAEENSSVDDQMNQTINDFSKTLDMCSTLIMNNRNQDTFYKQLEEEHCQLQEKLISLTAQSRVSMKNLDFSEIQQTEREKYD